MTDFLVVMCDDLPAVDGRLEDNMAFIGDLRAEGYNFTWYETASPRCGPNRWAWFIAMLSRFTGAVDNDHAHAGFSHDPSSTIATALAALGFRCGLFGKYLNGWSGFNALVDPFHEIVPPGWWIGHDPAHPERSGWQAFRSNGDFFVYDLLVGNPGLARTCDLDERGTLDGGRMNPLTDYSTDLMAYRATRFILDPDADPDAGMFVYFAPKAPHAPGTPADRHEGDCAGIGVWNPPSWNEAEVDWSDPPTNLIVDKPLLIRRMPLLVPGSQENLASRCETLQAVDEGAEDIYNAFVTAGRDDDLLVLYMADNGFMMGEHRVESGKAAMYRPSRRVTMVAHWAGHMGSAPRDIDHPVSTIDVPATIVDIAGATWGHDLGTGPLAATSFREILEDETAEPARTELPVEQDIRVQEMAPWFGFNDEDGNFMGKLVFGSPTDHPDPPMAAAEGELYLAADPDELTNRYYDPAHAALKATMEARWDVLAGTLPFRPYLEGRLYITGDETSEYAHVGKYDSTTSDDNITIPLLRDCPAGWHIVIAGCSTSSAGCTVDLTDTDGGNAYQTDHEQNDGSFAIWLASLRIDVGLGAGEEVRLDIRDEFGVLKDVPDRHGRAFLVRNLHETAWFDHAVFAAANSASPLNPITTTENDEFLISATSYAIAGGVLREAPGFIKEDSWAGAGRRFGVQQNTVYKAGDFRFGAELSSGATSWRNVVGAYFKNPVPGEVEPPEVPSGVQRVLMFVR